MDQFRRCMLVIGVLGLSQRALGQLESSQPNTCLVINGSTCVTDGAGNYGTNENCDITVLQSGFLTFEGTFDVEFHSSCSNDYILVGGVPYCGAAGPINVPVSQSSVVSWVSNRNTVGEGWTLCWTQFPTPTQTLSIAATASLEHCNITEDSSGRCISSGAGIYSPGEYCRVAVGSSGFLSAVGIFDVEYQTSCSLDFIQIGSQRWCGAGGPSNVPVAAGTTFTWQTDNNLNLYKSGWTICWSESPITVNPLVVTVGTDPAHCPIVSDGNCVSSRISGGYGPDERCTIQVSNTGYLTAVGGFDTEYSSSCGHDYISIGGQNYCGAGGPSNIAVSGGSTIRWVSDSDGIFGSGWQICWSATPAPVPEIRIVSGTSNDHCQLVNNGNCATTGNGSYSGSELCVFEVRDRGYISTSGTFDVEYSSNCYYDYIQFGNRPRFCGGSGPFNYAVGSQSTFTWQTGSSATTVGTGWTLCWSDTPRPTQNLQINFSTSPAHCQYTGIAGNCVTTGETNYGPSEDCTVVVKNSGYLSATGEFDVQYHSTCASDYVEIGSERFCGFVGPINEFVRGGSIFHWHSDSSTLTVGAGWTICWSEEPVAVGNLQIEESIAPGQCQISSNGRCVTVGSDGDYGANEECTISVRDDGYLSTVGSFDVQFPLNNQLCSRNDYLQIGTEFWCGGAGPHNIPVVAGDEFEWHTDSSGDSNSLGAGWTVCWTDAPVPTPKLLVTRASAPDKCVISPDGLCVTRSETNFDQYGNNEKCTISVSDGGYLTAVGPFDVQYGHQCQYDSVTIGADRYCGIVGPLNVPVASGSLFHWDSDTSITLDGWSICWSEDPVEVPALRYAATTNPSECEAVVTDNGTCITSQIGAAYAINQDCTFQIDQPGFITAEGNFDIEYDSGCNRDRLTINGDRYCGFIGPHNVPVTAGQIFTWSTTSYGDGDGWKVCWSATPNPTPVLKVTAGSNISHCQIGLNGTCMTVGNNSGQYTRLETCEVSISAGGYLSAVGPFDVQYEQNCNRDYLQIGSTRYCGFIGPVDVVVGATSTFRWISDGSVNNEGFTICWQPALTYFAPLQLTRSANPDWCQISEDGHCVSDGADNYGINEDCTIVVRETGYLSAVVFEVASTSTSGSCSSHYIEIGGQRYCTPITGAPLDIPVIAGSTIVWRSGSSSDVGWNLCWTAPPSVSPTTNLPTTLAPSYQPSTSPASQFPTKSPSLPPIPQPTLSPSIIPTPAPTFRGVTRSPSTVSPSLPPSKAPTTLTPASRNPTSASGVNRPTSPPTSGAVASDSVTESMAGWVLPVIGIMGALLLIALVLFVVSKQRQKKQAMNGVILAPGLEMGGNGSDPLYADVNPDEAGIKWRTEKRVSTTQNAAFNRAIQDPSYSTVDRYQRRTVYDQPLADPNAVYSVPGGPDSEYLEPQANDAEYLEPGTNDQYQSSMAHTYDSATTMQAYNLASNSVVTDQSAIYNQASPSSDSTF